MSGPAIHFAMATLPLAPGHVLSYCGAFIGVDETVSAPELVACVTCREGLGLTEVVAPSEARATETQGKP
jgi:hypothetical protein